MPPRQHGCDDPGNVIGCLACSENDFGKALTQAPVMVYIGEAEVFEGQVSQPLERLIVRESAGLQIFENLTELIFSHKWNTHCTATSLIGRNGMVRCVAFRRKNETCA